MIKQALIFLVIISSTSFAQDNNADIQNWKSILFEKKFNVVKSVNKIDTLLLRKMELNSGVEFDLTNPNEEWDASCTKAHSDLPRYQLRWFASVGQTHIIVYTIGGFKRSLICYMFNFEKTEPTCYATRLDNYYDGHYQEISFKKFKKDVERGKIDITSFDKITGELK